MPESWKASGPVDYPSIAQRRENPHLILLQFKEPVTEELLDEIEHMLKYRAGREVQANPLHDAYAAYDDGFGRIVRTEPKSS